MPEISTSVVDAPMCGNPLAKPKVDNSAMEMQKQQLAAQQAELAAKRKKEEEDLQRQQANMQAGLTGPRSLMTNDETGYQRTLMG